MNRAETIVVFAGAGASKGVNPQRYPTTVEFFERLPEEIKQDQIFESVCAFLQERTGPGAPMDIELLLWRLDELQAFCVGVTDPSSLPGWMVGSNRLAHALNRTNETFGHLDRIARMASRRVEELTAKIHAQVYKLYGQLPERSELEATWLPLLEPLVRSGAVLELFTTNYDMILEAALDALAANKQSPVDTGWRGTVLRRLDAGLWTRRREPSSDGGLLTKLHGSVNWTRDGDTIYVSDPIFKGSHKRHVIIYPGFKGRPVDPIFQAFHNHLADALSRAVGVVFIGFAFRDDHINDLCDRALPTTARVAVIDPIDELKHQFQGAVPHHLGRGSGFNRSTAAEAAEVLLRALSTRISAEA